LDERGRLEGQRLREGVGEVGPHRHVLREAARQREAELVVGGAQVRLPPAAPGARPAEVVSLHDHAVARGHPLHALTVVHDRPAPLVPGDHRVLHVRRRPRPLHHLDVAHAHAGRGHPHQDLAVACPGGGLLAEGGALRRPDHDGFHGPIGSRGLSSDRPAIRQVTGDGPARTFSATPQEETMTARLSRFWTLAVVALLAASALEAQLTTGSILGTVSDPAGGVVAGAKVTATQRDTGFSRSGQTDAAGAFSFPSMPLGRYDVKVEHEGFKTKVVGPVTLIVDQKLRTDIVLDLGRREETVEVTGAATLLQTDQPDVNQIVQEKEIRALPLNGRDFFSLLLLSNGVQDTSNDQGG